MNREELIVLLQDSFRTICANESIVIAEGNTVNDISEWTSLNHMLIIADVEKKLSIKFKLKEAIDSAQGISQFVNNTILKL